MFGVFPTEESKILYNDKNNILIRRVHKTLLSYGLCNEIIGSYGLKFMSFKQRTLYYFSFDRNACSWRYAFYVITKDTMQQLPGFENAALMLGTIDMEELIAHYIDQFIILDDNGNVENINSDDPIEYADNLREGIFNIIKAQDFRNERIVVGRGRLWSLTKKKIYSLPDYTCYGVYKFVQYIINGDSIQKSDDRLNPRFVASLYFERTEYLYFNTYAHVDYDGSILDELQITESHPMPLDQLYDEEPEELIPDYT